MQFCWTLRCALCTCRTVPCTISTFLEVCAAMARKRKRHSDTGYRQQSSLVRPPKASNAADVQQLRKNRRHLQQFVTAASGKGAPITSCFCDSTFFLLSCISRSPPLHHYGCTLASSYSTTQLAPLWPFCHKATRLHSGYMSCKRHYGIALTSKSICSSIMLHLLLHPQEYRGCFGLGFVPLEECSPTLGSPLFGL